MDDYDILKSYLEGIGYIIHDVDVVSYGGLTENESFQAGNEIWVGRYDNEEYRLVSLAHEAGHTLSYWGKLHGCFDFHHENVRLEHSSIIVETMAWDAGLRLLDELHLDYSDDVFKYINDCLVGYCGYKG